MRLFRKRKTIYEAGEADERDLVADALFDAWIKYRVKTVDYSREYLMERNVAPEMPPIYPPERAVRYFISVDKKDADRAEEIINKLQADILN